MRGPLELLGDAYDYHYDYYRWFAHRRFIFSEYSLESLRKDMTFNIFRNKDSENVGSLVKQTTLIGGSLGLSLASMRYLLLTDFNKLPHKKALPIALGVLLMGTGIGFSYGIVVNASSKFRDNKDGAVNHIIAAMATIPVVGVYAKNNKVYWGIYNAILLGAVLGVMKYGGMGKLPGIQLEDWPKKLKTNEWATSWRRQ